MPEVGIIDYGMGNLRSVEKGLQKVGVDARLCAEPVVFDSFDGLVLPGVGAFGDAMDNLRSRGMDEAMLDYIATGRHVLGICLGLQMLFDYSEEHGRSAGLGVIPGRVVRLPGSVKVPHMGWNALNVTKEVPLFSGVQSGSRFYFVHSFYCEPEDGESVIGTTPYGLEFACAVRHRNVWGLQFHPEKSSLLGLEILRNFGNMVAESQ